jgi:RND family efflux transporter MFP subunit
MSPVVRSLRPLAMIVRLIVPPLILAVGLWAGWQLFRGKAAPELTPAPEAAAVVRVVDTPAMNTTIDVTAWGTVMPSRTLSLRPEVSGRLTSVAPKFMPGGVFLAGEELARIDERDYQYALQQAESTLETARFNLELEEGRGRVAKRDWELLGDEIEGEESGSRMALRAPHLAEKQAAFQSAVSRVEQARLSLLRTVIVAPFNSMIVSESSEIGQIVSSSTSLGTLVGTDEYWVEIGVPLEDVATLEIGEGEPRPATVTIATGGGGVVEYKGVVSGLTGSVDSAGRLARVLVSVPKPLEQSRTRAIPLLLESYVKVRIQGSAVRGVRSLPRSVVREGNRVWIAGPDDRLIVRDIEVVGGSPEAVLARVELANDEAIISSPIPAVAPGMLIQRESVE